MDAVDAEQLPRGRVGEQLTASGMQEQYPVPGTEVAALLDLGDPRTFLWCDGAAEPEDDLDMGAPTQPPGSRPTPREWWRASVHGSRRHDPLGGLTRHRSDEVEVVVVVQHDGLMALGDRRDDQISH